MRISDWSSDVCSSDLGLPRPALLAVRADQAPAVHVCLALSPTAPSRPTMALMHCRPDRFHQPQTGHRFYQTQPHQWLPAPAHTVYWRRSEEHTSDLQSLMRISYAVFCLKKQKKTH